MKPARFTSAVLALGAIGILAYRHQASMPVVEQALRDAVDSKAGDAEHPCMKYWKGSDAATTRQRLAAAGDDFVICVEMPGTIGVVGLVDRPDSMSVRELKQAGYQVRVTDDNEWQLLGHGLVLTGQRDVSDTILRLRASEAAKLARQRLAREGGRFKVSVWDAWLSTGYWATVDELRAAGYKVLISDRNEYQLLGHGRVMTGDSEIMPVLKRLHQARDSSAAPSPAGSPESKIGTLSDKVKNLKDKLFP